MKNKMFYLFCFLFLPVIVKASTVMYINCDEDLFQVDIPVSCKLYLETTDKISTIDATVKSTISNVKLSDFDLTNRQWQGGLNDGHILLYSGKSFTGKVEIGTFKATAVSSTNTNGSITYAKDGNEKFEVFLDDDRTRSELSIGKFDFKIKKEFYLDFLYNNSVLLSFLGVMFVLIITFIIYIVSNKKD